MPGFHGSGFSPPGWYHTPYYPNPNPPAHLRDQGPYPFTVNIEEVTLQNSYFRVSLWTGNHLQLTLMSLNAGEDIGLEMHPDTDQFLHIVRGQGLVVMGDSRENLHFRQRVYDNYVVFIPAGKWHNLINTGRTPLKLYSIYAPPAHPRGTVHRTKKEAEQQHPQY